MQHQTSSVQPISTGNAAQSIDERAALLLPPEVLAAIDRMYNGGTESDAMLYTATLATSMLSLAKMMYHHDGADFGEADRSTEHAARLMLSLADALSRLGFPMSEAHARVMSVALLDIQNLSILRDCCATKNGGASEDSKTKTYIIKSPASGLIKIGKSGKPNERINGLGTAAGCKLDVLAIIDDDIEAELHKRFASIRVYGEWFRDDGQIAAFAADVAA